MGYGSYSVYSLTFRHLRKDLKRRYIGITGVKSNQTARSALLCRKGWHEAQPVAWLKGFAPGSLQVSACVTGLPTLDVALAEEALVAARQYCHFGPEVVRGGAWVRRVLSRGDEVELAAAGACEDRDAVKKLAKTFPAGSLSKHLANEAFTRPQRSGTSSTPSVEPSFFLPLPKRRSGKHKPGVPRQSGRHKPGWRPSSGASGTNQSGAEKRFNRLPVPMFKVHKRPAASR